MHSLLQAYSSMILLKVWCCLIYFKLYCACLHYVTSDVQYHCSCWNCWPFKSSKPTKVITFHSLSSCSIVVQNIIKLSCPVIGSTLRGHLQTHILHGMKELDSCPCLYKVISKTFNKINKFLLFWLPESNWTSCTSTDDLSSSSSYSCFLCPLPLPLILPVLKLCQCWEVFGSAVRLWKEFWPGRLFLQAPVSGTVYATSA